MQKTISLNGRQLQIEYSTEADESVTEEVLIDEDYKMVRDIIKNAQSCILDIGAHIGAFSLYVRSLNSKVPIYALEPEARNFSLLKKNIKLNRLQNMTVARNAVSGVSGEQILNVASDSHNHSLLSVENMSSQQVVYGRTLKDIFAKYRLPKCDLLKLDIEGAEFEVLSKTPSEIFAQVRNFLIEYHQVSLDHNLIILQQVLSQNKFRLKTYPSFYNQKFGLIWACS